jgi:glutamate carboxypeptidase
MTGLTRSEAELIEPVDLAPMLEQTLAWAAINSGTRNLSGLKAMADQLADAFSTLPGTVELVAPDATEAVSTSGDLVAVEAGRHLVVRVRPQSERRVLITGHMDTVYPADDPFQACEWIDDRRLRGPGVLDMKGGIALMLAGLRAFEASGPSIGYDVVISSDEETGSGSSAPLITGLAEGKFAALTYEPSLPGGIMARARPGSGNFSAIVRGRSAHAGRNPEQGRNALVAGADFALRLAKAGRAGLSVNPARIDGGGPNNVVPALAIVRFNIRPRATEDAAEAIALVTRLAAEISAEHDVSVDVHGGIGRPAKPIDAATTRLFAIVARAAADLGEALSWQDSGGVCDGNNIASCGVPVIDTMGACGEFIHSPGEYLDTASLVPKARLSALVLHRLERGSDRQ